MIRRFRRVGALAAAMVAFSGVTACSGSDDEEVVVLGSWSESEVPAFQGVLDAFTTKTGIKARYRPATRMLDQELRKDLQTGTQPHVAILPSPGQLATFAAEGALHPIDEPQGQYGSLWSSINNAVRPNGSTQRYIVPIKVNLKSAVWYHPPAMKKLFGDNWTPPANLNQLTKLTADIRAGGATPWCMGVESTPVSGWPGTDWIENFLLHRSSTDVYQGWVSGSKSWVDIPEIAGAFDAWGDIVSDDRNINGGNEGALLTAFADASRPLFTTGCYLHLAAYVEQRGELDFFPFPDEDPQSGKRYEVSGDFAAMLRSTPQAKQLIKFLSSDEGQRLWASTPGSGAFSPNPTVGQPKDLYRDSPVSQRIAEILTQQGSLMCFDASDLMPTNLSNAFNQAILTYLSDPARFRDTANLNALLERLDKVRTTAADTRSTTGFRCGQA